MKQQFILVICICLFTPPNEVLAFCDPAPSIEALLIELELESNLISAHYATLNDSIRQDILQVRVNLSTNLVMEEQIALLIQKDELISAFKRNRLSQNSDISKVRYLKGLQIIRILYEKTLSLDHHFSSTETLNEINKISNPNTYKEFANIKELMNEKGKEKSGFELSALLNNNMYTSIIHSFVSLFTNENKSKNEKEKVLQDAACILDFTLRVHTDLNTIHFETIFLKKNNEAIMEELLQLFEDYTEPIKYETSLVLCRDKDDWELIGSMLNDYIEELETATKNDFQSGKVRRMQVNLQFPIDRLLQFIIQYNAFINQSSKFYEKFGIMLNSYQNEDLCSHQIPISYKSLQENIALATQKFNTAYKPIEINGSKMKELLYGLHEYD